MLVGWLVGGREGGEWRVVENNKWASRRIETTKTKRIYTKKLKEVKNVVCLFVVCLFVVFSFLQLFLFLRPLICSSRFYPLLTARLCLIPPPLLSSTSQST